MHVHSTLGRRSPVLQRPRPVNPMPLYNLFLAALALTMFVRLVTMG